MQVSQPFDLNIIMKKFWITLFLLPGWAQAAWDLLDPKGPIAADEKQLILTAFALMLIVVIPVIIMTFAFAWKYRASNTAATYAPKWDYSHQVEAVVWLVPAVIVLILSSLVWRSTHALTPEKPLISAVRPLTVQVVAMNWKWLFIYPEQGVASVNELVIPVGTPVQFLITSDSVMNSFFIPRLGGQIYAMAGMQTELNLQADEAGNYRGLDTQFSGAGFSGMHFETRAMPAEGFQDWVKNTHKSRLVLDDTRLKQLEVPSENVTPTRFSRVTPQLFESILQKYAPNAGAQIKG
jgi:cytochrome o ubiquinol oxidase subunit 2